MKLYSKPGACSTADHIALQWTGQPFEVEVVTQQQIKEPAFLAMNPAGAVPVIVYGGPAGARLRSGRLADLAPTVLDLMGLDKPAEMTGESLIETA